MAESAETDDLIGFLRAQTKFLEGHASLVDSLIAEAGPMAPSLQSAKNKSLEEQRDLLRKIIGQLDPFLDSIVLYQNKLDHIWAAHATSAADARARHCPNISRYETSVKVESDVGSFSQLVLDANIQFAEFKRTIQRVSDIMKERGIHAAKNSGASIKQMERAFFKAFFVYKGSASYRKLTDMLRASFVFDSFDDLYRAFNVLEEVWAEYGGILRAKDRFAVETAPFGYRDMLLNVYTPGSGIVCEVQLHHVSMYNNKKGSHAIYKKARVFNSGEGNKAFEFAQQYVRPKIGDEKEPDESLIDKLYGTTPTPTVNEQKGFRQILEENKLSQFADALEADGWDDPEDWKLIEEDELKELGFKKGHLKKWARVLQKLEEEESAR